MPKTPRSAYNPDRPAGALLKAQLKNVEWAVRPAGERLPGMIDLPPNPTEREVAARIQALMKLLHKKTLGRDPIIKPAAGARKARRISRGRRAKASRARTRVRRARR